MSEALARLRRQPFGFALLLSACLLIATILFQPNFAKPSNYPEELATLAPLAIAAMASTPSVVSGGGGLDVSVGPTIILINVIFVSGLLKSGITSGWLDIPILLAIGTGIGLINGLLVARLRFQPVIATLCSLFIISGLAMKIAGNPVSAPPNWSASLIGRVGPLPGAVYLMAAPALIWFGLGRTPFHRALYAVGGNDATAYSAGVNVFRTRLLAYGLNGMFAAIGGIAFTVLVQSTQASSTSLYTLVALAAVALGGTPLYGGRGGLVCSFFGALALYLVQTLLSAAQIPATWLDLVYGVLLVAGVIVGARVSHVGPGPGPPAPAEERAGAAVPA
jgi:ribose transport system permease protein